MGKLDFWHEFGSTYSYLPAMRIETLAAEIGVDECCGDIWCAEFCNQGR